MCGFFSPFLFSSLLGVLTMRQRHFCQKECLLPRKKAISLNAFIPLLSGLGYLCSSKHSSQRSGKQRHHGEKKKKRQKKVKQTNKQITQWTVPGDWWKEEALGEENKGRCVLKRQRMELSKHEKTGKARETLREGVLWKRWQRGLWLPESKISIDSALQKTFQLFLHTDIFLKKHMAAGFAGFLTPPATAMDWHN